MVLLKILAIMALGFITFQDFKERRVFWFLFPLLALLMTSIHFLYSPLTTIFFYHILLNLLAVLLVLTLVFLYTRLVQKKRFVDHSLGLGDMLLFIGLAMAFPTVTFLILFTSSLFCSLIAFFALKGRSAHATIPLAGLMGLFFSMAIGYSLFFEHPSLYIF